MRITINTVKWEDTAKEGVVVNGEYHVPIDTDNLHWQFVQAWVAEGNAIEEPDPDPVPPTDTERLDAEDVDPVLLAFIKAFAKHQGITLKQIRDAIVAEM